MEELSFRLEVFEGPLDLLLALIAKNKVDISDIPIALILDQYMEYISSMRELDMELSGEFIVMASELMLIKSRMLLPKPPAEEEEDPREKLARALLEYKRAKENAVILNERYQVYGARIVKDTEVIDTSHDMPENLDVTLLERAFGRILRRSREIPRLAKESERALQRLLQAKIVPVGGRIFSIMRILYREGVVSVEDILLRSGSRSEIIAYFLALLELLRSQRVRILPAEEDGDGMPEVDAPVYLTLDRTHRRKPAAHMTEERTGA